VGVAEEFGVTLAGFVRDGRLTVYTGAERVVPG
jgi:formate dehydrogenase assembly factor FdhD